ncbi:MAG: ABC transporter permease [Caldilineales bacterium]
MSKLLTIGFKDLRIMFRDRAALILMLAAPFVLTLGLGLVTGGLSQSTGAVSNVPVVVVNNDAGTLGQSLATVITSADLAGLFDASVQGDVGAARSLVEEGTVAAAVIIPAGFTDSIIPSGASGQTGPLARVEVFRDPGRPVSSGVVQAVVESFINQVETGRIGGQIAIEQLLASGAVAPADVPQIAAAMGEQSGREANLDIIRVRNTASGAVSAAEIDPMSFLAPGMAMLFLMYTVSLGGRSILDEQREGTLARMLSTPTRGGQVLTGKTFGIYFVGVAQMMILIVASTLLFRLDWGDPLAVFALVLSIVAGAAGWGLLLAAVAKTPSQVSSVGMAMALLFGLIGGSFFGGTLTGPLGTLSKITPNAWGQDGFAMLARGDTLVDLLPAIAALWVMCFVLVAVAVAIFNRKGMLQR